MGVGSYGYPIQPIQGAKKILISLMVEQDTYNIWVQVRVLDGGEWE